MNASDLPLPRGSIDLNELYLEFLLVGGHAEVNCRQEQHVYAWLKVRCTQLQKTHGIPKGAMWYADLLFELKRFGQGQRGAIWTV